MTKNEAVALAEKRESHKSKHMVTKMWKALHTEEKGWHVALVNSPLVAQMEIEKARQEVQNAYANCDIPEFLRLNFEYVMLKAKSELSEIAESNQTD